MRYFQPISLDEALEIRAAHPVTILAGGTDIYPAKAAREAWGDTREGDILDISRLEACRGIQDQGQRFRLGALTTWTQCLRADLPPYFDGLKQAAREVGGAQIQNRGTLAGTLCNASPAADGVPVLLTLDAAVELAGPAGSRAVPLSEFIVGYRQTACAQSEIVTAILIPKPDPSARARFLKLGARRYLVISIVMVAGLLQVGPDGRIADLRLAVGACSPVARRLAGLERRLLGAPGAALRTVEIDAQDLEALSPIDDCRASGSYRSQAAATLTRRLLLELGELAAPENRRA